MAWYKFVVYIHIVGAIIWVGGILFLGFVAAPAARRLEDDTRSKVMDVIGRRFVTVGYTTLGVLITTGIVQTWQKGATWASVFDGSFFRASTFGQRLGMKLIFIVVMLAVTVSHDFYFGPAAVRAAQAGRDTARYRKIASWLARITALLALIVIAYATQLVR